MNLSSINENFSVCKLSDCNSIDLNIRYTFLSVTDDEISLVCPTDRLPPNVTHIEHGWKALKIQGELDFSLIGILANISRLLAENNISIFVVSTYNTDYILVKEQSYKQAIDILKSNDYHIT